MSGTTLVGTVLVVLAAVTAFSPTTTFAQRAGGGRGMGGGQGTISASGARESGRPVAQGAFRERGPGHHHQRFGHHHQRGSGFVGFAPPFWYAAAPYYYPYYSQSVYDVGLAYAPPTYSVVTPPAPLPSVVEYPTGRYELRGDGYWTPYHWIWIPNPPPAPPPPAPPASQPAPPAPPASTTPEPRGHTTVYRWTDAEGAVHFTDRLDRVPLQYRALAKLPRAL